MNKGIVSQWVLNTILLFGQPPAYNEHCLVLAQLSFKAVFDVVVNIVFIKLFIVTAIKSISE